MNKKGFTLIELLAVIVILAIIALIATPIVLNIINDSRESAGLRSAEMYLKGLETSVATSTINSKKVKDGTYPIMSNGNICLVELTNNTCSEDDTLKVEMNGEKPESGSVTIVSGKIIDIELTYTNGKTIVKKDGKLVYGEKEKTIDDICKYQNNGVEEKTAGAKYSCEVKPGTSYNFYVVKTPAEGETTINLEMDRNICEDGTPATESNKCFVAWISDSDYGCEGTDCAENKKGPVTAMTYLYNATKDWTNIDPVNYTYNDREDQGATNPVGYTSFVSTNGVATITAFDETTTTIGSKTMPLRARMPIYLTNQPAEAWSNENLNSTVENGIYGFWSLSSFWLTSSMSNQIGDCVGENCSMQYVYDDSHFGVRPVINLKI